MAANRNPGALTGATGAAESILADTSDITPKPAAPQYLSHIADPSDDAAIADADRRANRANFVAERLRARQRQAAKEAARDAWAALNGWKVAPRSFTIKALSERKASSGKFEVFPCDAMDHAQSFRDGRYPAAIVAHNYAGPDIDGSAKLCVRHGLVAHRPPALLASWYWPGNTYIVAYTRPGVAVRWLPEQSDSRWAARS